VSLPQWLAAWCRWLWRWLIECEQDGCTERPVILGYCASHARPYEEGVMWGDTKS
jgi:hypothetical protein